MGCVFGKALEMSKSLAVEDKRKRNMNWHPSSLRLEDSSWRMPVDTSNPSPTKMRTVHSTSKRTSRLRSTGLLGTDIDSRATQDDDADVVYNVPDPDRRHFFSTVLRLHLRHHQPRPMAVAAGSMSSSSLAWLRSSQFAFGTRV
ncbi:hypothetical protein HMN09_00216400 [Mycena chlorophos]|uniref:Uncharacterized protein n=1 Tax=Mycena chlorophos TaxID=658473 RepID=A0A8H6WJ43_MYCCL|nr:hypothetical protein HMN09_00216400 [Mycena chlorophos]